MGNKVYQLVEICDVQGRPFQGPAKDEEGNVIREVVRDTEGKPVMQIPRDLNGNPLPNCQPEPVYKIKTTRLGKDSLPEIMKGLYLNIPKDKLTRQDTIYGARMFTAIAACQDGVLEIPDDVHDWLKEKLKDEAIGKVIFAYDLYVVEQAIDNFDRPYEKGGIKNDDAKPDSSVTKEAA